MELYKNKNCSYGVDFKSLRVLLASPETILSWSYGEVTNINTINYKTKIPELNGLFCAKIFGPIRNYECICKNYNWIPKGTVFCERCKVDITTSWTRRKRMAHIELNVPVVHIWYFKSIPSQISLILNIPNSILNKIIYYELYVILSSKTDKYKTGEFLTLKEVVNLNKDENVIYTKSGSEAILFLLSKVNLIEIKILVLQELNNTNNISLKKKLANRLKTVELFTRTHIQLEWMIIKILPVLPPDLRPIVPLEEGKYASSDLNELYKKVIYRNNRLYDLLNSTVPLEIINNEKRLLQEAVDALINNKKCKYPILDTNERPLKSLSDILKGKKGRFRYNLLGKRVDYSARSVIIPGPELYLNQCGVPISIAFELFKPFIYSKLILNGYVNNLNQAKMVLESKNNLVLNILKDLTKYHPIILNRAPTLHRLGIQAFKIKLINLKAIMLHPLVCVAYNADFDGDQMAIHLPLSLEAQLEARILMFSTNNVLHPANGEPIIVPTQDMIIGLYYLSIISNVDKDSKIKFTNFNEVRYALDNNIIKLNSKIEFYKRVKFKNKINYIVYKTTAGRILINELIPKKCSIFYDITYPEFTKSYITSLIDIIFRICNKNRMIEFCNKVMELGFKYAFIFGLSFSKIDIPVSKSKNMILSSTFRNIEFFDSQYKEGFISKNEYNSKLIDSWNKATEKITNDINDTIFFDAELKNKKICEINSVYIMIYSGARGSITQIRQLGGIKGLMIKPSGKISNIPIISSFKEGLSMIEFFFSAHGSRKGLIDTALKTASSGYLTRRLVEASQDCCITMYDCYTDKGLFIYFKNFNSNKNNILGRILLISIVDKRNIILIYKNSEVNEFNFYKIFNSKVNYIIIRSPVTCKCIDGICVLCYGRDLSKGKIVNLGEAVGIIAAQAIGEPGTQLTLRTFHKGGTFNIAKSQLSSDRSPCYGKIKLINLSYVINSNKDIIVVNNITIMEIYTLKKKFFYIKKIKIGTKLYVKNNDPIVLGQILYLELKINKLILSLVFGYMIFKDVIRKLMLVSNINSYTGLITYYVNSKRNWLKLLVPYIEFKNTNKKISFKYHLKEKEFLTVRSANYIHIGDLISYFVLSIKKKYISNLIGGLSKISSIFENHISKKNKALVVLWDCNLKYGNLNKKNRVILLKPQKKNFPILEYKISNNKTLLNNDNNIKKGTHILGNELSLSDLFISRGFDGLTEYFVNKIQEIYKVQGIYINNKHIEIVLKQLLNKIEITSVGDSRYYIGEYIKLNHFNVVNQNLCNHNKKLAKGIHAISGITKISLSKESFLSCASFQNTEKTLVQASIDNKIDYLCGLKENIILSKIIPVGTGIISKINKDLSNFYENELYINNN